ncbi:sarcosine oxidase subunit gamma [Burkholderia multivorans]|uniref:sarcosine oxidase subunit gamma n=1 Tax=Burkholderia multivorans TaxID=87883 RepID=UPI000278081C|nr:sarcosine oxidase subunit gamma family protein [Burkholderia multivorans]EJO54195.1 sarcosine oxidase, gamma subunit family protein [Burkholderia multivorans CF2]MBJ9657246.1 sarcosine oxidase subunit gamma [Burkholderia multivorans]MBR8046462.1 sarcosine oxidase subunit gamma [Burkholderia multivorans]MBU9470229.1 sarcosine oxidase subunit gamma [Burkholderia multivorans]MCA8335387.1 sarcosine oxidase subunit gamma [Burkholderia multivorans]
MLNDLVQESPLVDIEARIAATSRGVAGSFQLTERPFVTLLALRGNGAKFEAAVQRVLGLALPRQSGSRAVAGERAAWWMGPDEWLIQSTEDMAVDLEHALRDALTGQHYAVVDVSSGYTVIDIAGTHVREVLASGCPLDLHRRVFADGQCASTHFFKAGITLCRDGDARFQVIVRRSFAEYCCLMLLDAAEPYLV